MIANADAINERQGQHEVFMQIMGQHNPPEQQLIESSLRLKPKPLLSYLFYALDPVTNKCQSGQFLG